MKSRTINVRSSILPMEKSRGSLKKKSKLTRLSILSAMIQILLEAVNPSRVKTHLGHTNGKSCLRRCREKFLSGLSKVKLSLGSSHQLRGKFYAVWTPWQSKTRGPPKIIRGFHQRMSCRQICALAADGHSEDLMRALQTQIRGFDPRRRRMKVNYASGTVIASCAASV